MILEGPTITDHHDSTAPAALSLAQLTPRSHWPDSTVQYGTVRFSPKVYPVHTTHIVLYLARSIQAPHNFIHIIVVSALPRMEELLLLLLLFLWRSFAARILAMQRRRSQLIEARRRTLVVKRRLRQRRAVMRLAVAAQMTSLPMERRFWVSSSR